MDDEDEGGMSAAVWAGVGVGVSAVAIAAIIGGLWYSGRCGENPGLAGSSNGHTKSAMKMQSGKGSVRSSTAMHAPLRASLPGGRGPAKL